MNKVTHRYIVSLNLVNRIIKYIEDHYNTEFNTDMAGLKAELLRYRWQYASGLAHID